MLRKLSPHLLALFASTALGGCATAPPAGPGMTVHFSNTKLGQHIAIETAVTATGATFSNPGALSPSTNPMHEGKVMGAAPDRRGLPEWVQFTWTEHPEVDIERTTEEYQTWPRKSDHVLVKDRVPLDVVNEITQSNRNTPRNQLPDQSLWIYLIWTDTGIKLKWRQKSGCCKVLRSGGDQVD